jgi:hypothetical protein
LRRSVVLPFALLLLVTPATAQARAKLIGFSSATGALELRARVGVTSSRTVCPPGTTEGKGDVDVSLEAVPTCMHSRNKLLPPSRAFTVTGGTGIYAGASGGGTLKHSLRQAPGGAAGTDTWAGRLVVPGLGFDVTPPQLSESVARIVRVPRQSQRARVTFAVSASDDVDGSLPATCTPRSGSRFKLGKTRVTCSATDSGGNTATAHFTVTVRARS